MQKKCTLSFAALLCLVAVLFFPACNSESSTQETFEITVQGETSFPDSSVFELVSGSVSRARVTAAGGKYTLTAQVGEAGIYHVNALQSETGESFQYALFVEPGATYNVSDQPASDGYSFAVKSTSENQAALEAYEEGLRAVKQRADERKAFYEHAMDTTTFNALFQKFYHAMSTLEDSTKANLASYNKRFIEENPDKLVSAAVIGNAPDLADSIDRYEELMNKLSPEVKESAFAQQINQKIAQNKALGRGAQVPELQGRTLDNKAFEYDYSQNKLTLIDFWESESYESRKLRVKYRDFHKRYSGKGFDIISVSVDDYQTWKAALDGSPTPWTNINENKPQSESANVKNFFLTALPANVLVDGQGKIVGRNLTSNQLLEHLEEIDGKKAVTVM
jgi:hypothetical protein